MQESVVPIVEVHQEEVPTHSYVLVGLTCLLFMLAIVLIIYKIV